VLVHQLLALTLQFGAISPERCWEQLAIVADFSGIADSEFEILIQHMIREDFLFHAGGLLSMGDKAERVFGRKNAYMKLIASTPITLVGCIPLCKSLNFAPRQITVIT
jgi:ATP-dependent Lhr-like helicase